MFSPSLQKRKLETAWVPEPYADELYEGGNAEEREDALMDALSSEFVEDYAEDHEGTLFVRMGKKIYAFPCTAGEYIDFREAGYSTEYLNENFKIQYKGDWGWPYGRERNARMGTDAQGNTFFWTE